MWALVFILVLLPVITMQQALSASQQHFTLKSAMPANCLAIRQ
jgi:hypothetical protein